jgi:hypothetical protein
MGEAQPPKKDDSSSPAPVRIRLYGRFSVTRRVYLAQLTVSAVLLGFLLVLWSRRPRPEPGLGPVPGMLGRLLGLLNAIPWIVAGLVLLLTLEAVWVLRRFAREEARQRAALSEKPPTS